MKVSDISNEQIQKIREKTPELLYGNRPNMQGFSAEQLRSVLSHVLLDKKNSILALIQNLITEINVSKENIVVLPTTPNSFEEYEEKIIFIVDIQAFYLVKNGRALTIELNSSGSNILYSETIPPTFKVGDFCFLIKDYNEETHDAKVELIQKKSSSVYDRIFVKTTASQVEEEPNLHFMNDDLKAIYESWYGTNVVTERSLKKGEPNGVASLNESGIIPSSQLPSYVDDVIEFSSFSEFPEEGKSGKIYIDMETNLTYRWSGSNYTEISKSLALGENEATAYPGDKGKQNAEEIEKLKTQKISTDKIEDQAVTKDKIDSNFINDLKKELSLSGNNQGINLLTGTQDFSGHWKNRQWWNEEAEKYNGLTVMSSTIQWFALEKDIPTLKGQTYTFSVYVKADKETNVQLAWEYTGGYNDRNRFPVGTEWQHFVVTFVAPADGYIGPNICKYVEDDAKIYVCGYKLEYGENENPVWTPSIGEIINTDYYEVNGSVVVKSTAGGWQQGIVIKRSPDEDTGAAGIFIGAPRDAVELVGHESFVIITNNGTNNLWLGYGDGVNNENTRVELTRNGVLLPKNGINFGAQKITNIECGNGTLGFDSISTGAITSMSITFRNGNVGAGTWRVIASIENVSITLSISAISNNGFVLTARRINENIQDLFNFQWIAIKAED